MQLPVCGLEQEIVEAVGEHDVVILCGETGSGKSTQVPQFLYEAGYGAVGKIGVTQPRRIAAISTAQRVAFEMGTVCAAPSDGDGNGGGGGSATTGLVGYQIRHDKSTMHGDKTKLKFMTDGILLKEVSPSPYRLYHKCFSF